MKNSTKLITLICTAILFVAANMAMAQKAGGPWTIPANYKTMKSTVKAGDPSINSIGGLLPYTIYITVFAFLHNAWLFLLEAWQFGNIWYFLVKTVLSTVVSVLLVIITELIFVRKQKFRTNTI